MDSQSRGAMGPMRSMGRRLARVGQRKPPFE